MKNSKHNGVTLMAVIGGIAAALVLIIGTLQLGHSAKTDTETAARSVSYLYLDELAGRRQQVVADTLSDNIRIINIAIGLLTEEDLSDSAHLMAYQARMKKLFDLDRFAFVDSTGLIYTSMGTLNDIDQYRFNHKTLTQPDISVKNLEEGDKKVVIAVPVKDIMFNGQALIICFMEMDMDVLLRSVSMRSQTDATFCNIYTRDGITLSGLTLGGASEESSLFKALDQSEFFDGNSKSQLEENFKKGNRGTASFDYDGTQMSISYIPIENTDWVLTYLIRESVISDEIGSVSQGIIVRSFVQSALGASTLLCVFVYLIVQQRKQARFALERETTEAESRVKHQELERQLELQERLLEQERLKVRQDNLIKALSADYWSVYFIELDRDEGVCFQAHADLKDGVQMGEQFKYSEVVTKYANEYVIDQYRDEFLQFAQPENILAALAGEHVVSYRYVVHRNGTEKYEMMRFVAVNSSEYDGAKTASSVAACFTDVDAETRRTMAQNEALCSALAAAEEANKAKTAFLSNMSHEIRTPMNAIIGLDSIALNDPEISAKTRDYLVKMGDSAQHLLNLINDILDMSRIESGRMSLKNEEFSFSKLLEAINTIFSGQCQEKGLDYQCHIVGQVDDYYIGDSMKLRQVLINILGNAVKFTDAGGRVELTARRKAQFGGKTTVCFTISDTGIGMSSDFLPHIFDTFSQEDSSSTSKYGSSGLGMAITKNIVELMNGNIHVESEKGKGTTFTVTVTLMDSDRSGDEENGNELRPSELSVLIIDDDPIACEHGKLVLEKAGISADTVLSGAEALEMVKLRNARREPYNLILVDWKMPEMDGVETTRQIRSIVGDESAIIILTAYRWDDVLEQAMQAGVDSFIPKPMFAASVLDEFRQAMKRKGITAGKRDKKADLTGRRILVAEDVEVNAEIMVMILQMRQMEVEIAENGRIAVDKFASNPEWYYDAILMDMRMPEMDGLEATRTIRALNRPDAAKIPIIAMTANAFDEDVQRSLQAGLNAHLTKPVDPESLFSTLEGLIKD